MGHRWIQGLAELPAEARSCVLTIGNFDGVHLGHQKILSAARRLAAQARAPVVVMTFDPPPDLVLRPADEPQRITPPEMKTELLFEAGADWVVTVASNTELLGMSPEEFVERVVVRSFAPRQIVEGRGFSFGRGRTGNVETLSRTGPSAGFGVHVVEPVSVTLANGPQRVSSTLIRRLVGAGRVEDARRCLGRCFALCGPVIRGQGRGKDLAYPTANVDPGQQVIPGDGVYAGSARASGREYSAAISVGAKPTFGGVRRDVEAFLLDAEGDYYDVGITLRFERRLRGQQAFGSARALKRQIEKDVQRVRELHG